MIFLEDADHHGRGQSLGSLYINSIRVLAHLEYSIINVYLVISEGK